MVLRSSYYFSGQVLPLRSDWDSTTGVDLADTIIDLLVKTGGNMSPGEDMAGSGHANWTILFLIFYRCEAALPSLFISQK